MTTRGCTPWTSSSEAQAWRGLPAAAGHMNLVAAIIAGAAANLVGSLLAYWLAARFGEPLLLGRGRYVASGAITSSWPTDGSGAGAWSRCSSVASYP